jgi:hypothetical protein
VYDDEYDNEAGLDGVLSEGVNICTDDLSGNFTSLRKIPLRVQGDFVQSIIVLQH